MNKQVGKQFGEDNPSRLLPYIRVETATVAERLYETAFPVSGDASVIRNGKDFGHQLTTVATGVGPFPVKHNADTQRAIERDTFGRV